MRRRKFLGAIGGAAVFLPLISHAQKIGRNLRIGYLSPARLPQLLQALQDGLHDLGYIEGQNIVFDYRFAEGQAKTLDELAGELVRLEPDVIVTVASGAALAAKRATTAIPIVMATVGEPVGIGLVTSLARPGGNITGVTLAREFVEDGGLMAYGPNIAEMTRRSPSLIVKIIKGANPGDLPIEQPTTFELIINVQTGKVLGITFPATVLLRADKLIE
jgi:ABC-type uncharacterized transport system substrate-binding protein